MQLIRVCSDHGDCVSALAVYDWMTSSPAAGGAALTPTTYTYTAAMRAALGGHMHSRALHIWNDAWRRHQAGQMQVGGTSARACAGSIVVCCTVTLLHAPDVSLVPRPGNACKLPLPAPQS